METHVDVLLPSLTPSVLANLNLPSTWWIQLGIGILKMIILPNKRTFFLIFCLSLFFGVNSFVLVFFFLAANDQLMKMLNCWHFLCFVLLVFVWQALSSMKFLLQLKMMMRKDNTSKCWSHFENLIIGWWKQVRRERLLLLSACTSRTH